MNRQYDSRVAVAKQRLEMGEKVLDEEVGPKQILSDDIQKLNAACTPEETWEAVKKCQVGRASASYAEANLETPEETAARRKKEEKLENTEEAKKAKELIRKTLGSVMG